MIALYNAEILEQAVRLTTKEMRTTFEAAGAEYLKLEIEISGHVMHGDMLVQYTVCDSRYSNSVTGGSLNNAVNELFRRKGWTAENAPLCLPRVDDDDVKAL